MKIKNEHYKRFLRFLLSLTLVLAQTMTFAFVWITQYNAQMGIPFGGKGNLLFCLVHVILLTICLKFLDGMKYGIYQRSSLIISQILATALTLFITYLQIILFSVESVSIFPLLFVFFSDCFIIILIAFFGYWVFSKIFPPKKALLIYDKYSPDAFLEKVSARKDKFVIRELLNVSVGFEKTEEAIKEYESVIIYDVHSEQRNRILKICFENDIPAYTTTKISDILVRGAECLHLFDTPLLLYRNVGLTVEQRFFKRGMDLVLSVLLLVLTSPLFLIFALAIKLYDGGPVFFRQDRGTIDGRVFSIHKFRTMVEDADLHGVNPTEENDPRVTPIGKFLRAIRLDELPQLIDIIVGDMSLVGPRPERIEHMRQYSEKIPEFSYRLKIRGGLTGFAQLYGKYNTSPYDKLQLDLMYIQNYSLLLDIKLLLMTVKVLFMKESTEGFSKERSEEIKQKSIEKRSD